MERYLALLLLIAFSKGKVLFPMGSGDSISVSLFPPYPTGGDGFLTVQGTDDIAWTESAVVVIGRTACERTIWDSTTQLKCSSIPKGIGMSLDISVKDGAMSWTATNAFSYNAPSLTDLTPAYGSEYGLKLIQIDGVDFGEFKSPVAVFIGHTRCVEDHWVSDGVVTCLTPGADSVGSFSVTVVIAGQTAEMPHAYRYVPPGPDEIRKSPARIDQDKASISNLKEAGISLGQVSTISNRSLEFLAHHIGTILNPNVTAGTLQEARVSAGDIAAIMIAKDSLMHKIEESNKTVASIVNGKPHARRNITSELHKQQQEMSLATFNRNLSAESAHFHRIATYGFLFILVLVLLWQISTVFCLIQGARGTKAHYIPIEECKDSEGCTLTEDGCDSDEGETVDQTTQTEDEEQRMGKDRDTSVNRTSRSSSWMQGTWMDSGGDMRIEGARGDRESNRQPRPESMTGFPRWSWQAMSSLREVNLHQPLHHTHDDLASTNIRRTLPRESVDEWWQMRNLLRETQNE